MAEAGIESRRGLGVFTALWALMLIAAFLTYRGDDVGKLPGLVSNLGGGPLFGGSAFDTLLGFIVSILIIQAWVGLGRLVYGFLSTSPETGRRSMFLQFAICAGLGSAVWSLIWFVLGLAGGYTKLAALFCIAAGNLSLAIPAGSRPNTVRTKVNWREVRSAEWALILLIAIPIAMALIAALAPPVAKDTLLYHYALPKAYIAQHSNAVVDGNIASYLPLGAEMHYVWAMLLGGWYSQRAAEAAAGGVSFGFFVFLLYAIYGWARELNLERSWALLAVLITATVPTAYHVVASGYIDVALALFVTLSVYSLSRWWETEERGWLVLIAIFLGGALSIKLTSLFVFAAVALVILLRARKAKESSGNTGTVLLFGVGALLLAGVFASPWYLRTWKATGSPVFPFYMSMWKGEAKGWDVERSNLFQAMNSQYGGEQKSPADYILSPWNISVKAQPEEASYFDGVIGVSFLLGLPLLIFALWKFDLPTGVKIAAGITGIMFLFWLFSSQQLRYLLPVLPLYAFGIVVAATKVLTGSTERSIAKWSFVAAAVAGLLTTAAWFCQIAPVRVAFGGESRDQYLTRNLDYYPYYQWLNTQTSPDSKVWLINMRRDTYNLDRPVISDYLFEDWTLRKMIWDARSTSELRAKAAAMGVQYVLTRHDFLFDYERSTIVDDKKSRAENEAKLRVAKEFILDPAHSIKADDRFSLIKVF